MMRAEQGLRNDREPRGRRSGNRWGAAAAWIAVLALAPVAAADPAAIRGVVLDPKGEPVAAASVSVDGGEPAVTGPDGRFRLEIGAGDWQLEARHPAYQTVSRRVRVAEAGLEIELRFAAPAAVASSITVVGIRAGETLPVTTHEMQRAEIEAASYGQDVPALLERAPSMTWYSDSGIGSNYSYFSLRGIQQTRINMTLDGAPLNDPAEHALFFNNFHDFASAVDSIQIQRGVGTSSVGSPAYGGSVNFASAEPAAAPEGDARLVLGSFGTRRLSLGYETGLRDDGLYAAARLSLSETDGYRERSGSEHRTVFLNLGWQGARSSLKLVSFAGGERSQLAFLAVDPDNLRDNPRFNPLAEEERDDFGQRFAQLKYSRALGDETLLTASLYYNAADGVFDLWDDPAARGALLRFGIDQAFVGSMVTLHRTGERISSDFGIHYNDFEGDHTLEVAGGRLYENTGFKRTLSAFGKFELALGRWLLFGDLQLRWAEFSYRGDVDLGQVEWRFADPKIGLRRKLSPRASLYASIGRAQREPARLDLLQGEDNATVAHDLEAVRPEEVVDLELGLDLRGERLTLQANLYAMEFSDEIALTGELSEVGLPLRRNVDDSYRRGLEVDLGWRATPRWTLRLAANLSRNRIRRWTQFYDVFDEAGGFVGSRPIAYRDVPPLLSPEAIVDLGAEWTGRRASVALNGRYLSDAQLDNTGLRDFRLPSYGEIDLRAALDLGRWWAAGSARITLHVDNLLDREDRYPSGYSYQFLVRDAAGRERLDGIPFYYPRAGRNAFVALEVGL